MSKSGREFRAIYFTAPGRIEIREETLPEPTGDEIELHSLLQAISPGTERLMFNGDFPVGLESEPGMDGFSGSFEYPFRYGYINVARDQNGGRYFAFRDHATAFIARPEELIPLPDALDDELALLIPHTETALSIVQDLNPRLGARIMIAGAGIVGILTAELISRYQGSRVVLVDPLEDKARFLDTERVEFHTRAEEAPGFGSFDAAVDASASPAGLQSCIDAVGFESDVVVASWFGDRQVGLNLGRAFHRKRLNLISSQVSHLGYRLGPLWSKERRMDLTLDLVQELQRRDLITHRFSFSRAADAFTLINTPDESFGLVALEPEE